MLGLEVEVTGVRWGWGTRCGAPTCWRRETGWRPTFLLGCFIQSTFLLSVSYIRARHDSRYWRYNGEQDLIP